jgi:superfamily II DNA or RNA helicase
MHGTSNYEFICIFGQMTNLSHWNDIETHLSTADNQTKGELFEQLTEHFLRWSPKYQVILKHVWRLKDVPTTIREKLKIPNQDQGIDLIAESYEGKYWAIQCKYHGNYNKKISHREISTFLALSNTVASNIDFCLVATTADDYAQLYKGQNNIGFILSDTWTQLPSSFFDQFQNKEIVKPVIRNPRPHQIDAIAEAKKHFKIENRGKLIFPCGAGKSLTGYWITKELKAKTVIVAVPSLALVKQTLEDYCQESFAEGNPIAPFCICSDEGIGKNDDVAVFTQDLGVVCTTDKVKILDFLNFKTNRTKVLFTTYQSGLVLGDAVNEVNFKFDVGIMDESHKTVGATDKLFSHLLFDENVAIKKRIFMTATERRYKGSSENILSMDDPSVYGDTFTQLSFKEAIHQEILSDYKILTLVITQAEIKEYLNQNDFVKALGLGWEKDIDFRTLSSLVALRKAMHKFPIKHAVTFHSSIKRAKIFEQLQPIFDQAFPVFESVEAFHVTGAIPTSQRSKIIADFSQSDRGIITNAKCLTEGVDVPNIDCVLFADPRKSSIDIVQAVGRALRRSKGKDFGYVLLPVFAESNDKESIIESEDFQAILQTLRALASNDERIIEYFREKQKTENKSEKSDLVHFEIDEIIGNVFATDELLSQLELKVWSRLAKLSWRPFEEAREYARSMGINGTLEWFGKQNYSNLPKDIPLAASSVYRKEWTSWGDFLGTNYVALFNREYLSYEDAKKVVVRYQFKNANDYWQACRSGIVPSDIPNTPHHVYKSQFEGYGEFLGTGAKSPKNHEYMSFIDAKQLMKKHKISSKSQFSEWSKTLRPTNFPSNPPKTYANLWIGWPDFFETDNIKNREYYPFEKARRIVRLLKLTSMSKDWRKYTDSDSYDSKIPKWPDGVYNNKGWISWADFLGNDKLATQKRQYPDLVELRNIARLRNITSQKNWISFVKQKSNNSNLPIELSKVYKNKGWKGWADFLGKEDKE